MDCLFKMAAMRFVFLFLHGNRVYPERLQVEIGAAMERPPFPEHLPQDFTPYSCLSNASASEQLGPESLSLIFE